MWWAVVAVVAALAGAGAVVAIIRTNAAHPAAAPAPAPPASTRSSTSPTTTTAAPPVPLDALPGLLLGVEDLQTLLGIDGLHVEQDADQLFDGTLNRSDCGGVTQPALHSGYDGSGWLALHGQELRDAPSEFRHGVSQAVVGFRDSAAARAFVDTAAGRWGHCTDTDVTLTAPGLADEHVHVGTPGIVAGLLRVSTTYPAVAGWGCEHALSAHRNVVIDVRTCSYTGAGQTAVLTARIAEAIEGA